MRARLRKKYEKAKAIFEVVPNYSVRMMIHRYYWWMKFNKKFYRSAYRAMKMNYENQRFESRR